MYSTLTPRRPTHIQTSPLMGLGGLNGLGIGFDMVTSFNPVTAGISAGVGLATVALGSWLSNKRADGQARIASTSIVNDLEPLLNENKKAYLAGPRTCTDQAAALTAFDSAMQWLQSQEACGDPRLGRAGQNCINDRLPGGQWDWSVMYRNEIANDPMPRCNYAANSAEQAAVANLINHISGSPITTNAQAFTGNPYAVDDTSYPGYSTTGVPQGVLQATPTGTVNVAGTNVPTYVLIGVGAALLVLAVA